MEKKGSLLIVWSFIVVIVFVISACTPSRISVEEYEKTAVGDTEGQGEETSAPVDEPDATEIATPEPTMEAQVPEDVPIMDGAYQLQVVHGGTNVVYQIDSTIEEVATYYQEELPNYDWEIGRAPDNIIGSIATMLRFNPAGDRLAINMQANEVGGFVNLTLTISRVE
jgi:hypothetical protein